MPRGRQQVGSGGAIGTNVETVIAILGNISAPQGDAIDLEGSVSILAGTGTTAVVLRIRRGVDTTGAVVGGPYTHTLAAAANGVVTINAVDNLTADIAGGSYVLTAQQTGGTGNGTVNGAFLGALW